jgi:hypothetical protein
MNPEEHMRTPFRSGITGIALVTAGLLVVSATSASGEHQSSSSAYGVSVGGSPGQPSVEYTGGQAQTGGGTVPAELGPLAAGGVLALTAGNDRATATITDLTLGQAVADLPQELKDGIGNLTQACTAFEQAGDADQAVDPLNAAVDQIPGIGPVVDLPTTEAATTFCSDLLDADILSLAEVGTLQTQCDDKSGTVTLTDVEVLGAEQPVLAGQVGQETQLLPAELADVAKITLNHQTRDGENLTVEGLRVEVGGQEVAVLASATCGAPIAHTREPKPQQTVQEKSQQKPHYKPAPVPTPTRTTAPVTG